MARTARAGRRIEFPPEESYFAHLAVPEAGRTEYRLRSEHHVGGIATLEAIARALRVLEGDAGVATEGALLKLFRIMVARTLWLRG